jgi:hypothetical protein
MFLIFAVGSVASMMIIALILWSMRGLARGVKDQDRFFLEFLEKTGLRLADMPDAPLDEQVQALVQRYAEPSNWQQGFQLDYVKRAYGKEVQLQIQYKGAKSSTRWRVPLEQPPEVTYHIIKDTRVAPAFPLRVEIGDLPWDKKFQIHGEDPRAVRHILAASGLAEMLASCVTVDLCVLPGEVVFSDPANKNVNAAMGGLMGVALNGSDPQKMQDMVIPIYLHICDVVLAAASADA